MISLINIDVEKFPEPGKGLIKVVASAVEGLFKPWQVRRVAQAEADADRIKAVAAVETKIEITDLQKRALTRFVLEEAQRQANMEAITLKALPQVSKAARPAEMSKDWIVNFFERCRLVSDEEMQEMWARVLAGEAESPGRYSKRTVNLLASFDRYDVETFLNLCRFVWHIEGEPIPVVYEPDNQIFGGAGITFGKLQHLSEIGLVSSRGLAFGQQWPVATGAASYFRRAVHLRLGSKDSHKMNVGLVMFSRAGVEVLSLCGGAKPVEGYFDLTVRTWRETYKYEVQEGGVAGMSSHNREFRDGLTSLPPESEPPRWG
ncbi:MAG TPA: DUF2806 domain-containing protein [Verrucomicrobiota bacterium]|nr:DUF2806 domain-containing protein [Verrucomicrobiota bacterium]HNU51249.1 DUF2806 domain-containing protein [Verrucomicrobiota bacterium]